MRQNTTVDAEHRAAAAGRAPFPAKHDDEWDHHHRLTPWASTRKLGRPIDTGSDFDQPNTN